MLEGVFGGKKWNKIWCKKCGQTTKNIEDWPILSIEVKGVSTLEESLN